MEYWQILILAIIQGAAELLPVSSSAHVIFAARLMGERTSDPKFVLLLVMLHTGTMFAVIAYFWPRWRRLLAIPSLPTPLPEGEGRKVPGARRHFLLMLILATVVTGIIGLALKFFIEKIVLEKWAGHATGEVEKLFENLWLIAFALFAVGVLIIAAGTHEAHNEIGTVSTPSAVWIGLIQGICVPFRGFSRSGATISMGLFRGISRPLAEDFSFALAVILTPPIIVRQLLKVMKATKPVTMEDLVDMVAPGLAGMLLSFGAGLVALKLLSAVLESGRWKYFGYYCLFAAAVMAYAAWAGL